MEKNLTYPEAAVLLALSPQTLRQYVMCRKIPFYKIGKSVRFSESELETWLAEKRIPARGQTCNQ